MPILPDPAPPAWLEALENVPGLLGRAASRHRRLSGKKAVQAAFEGRLAALGPGDTCLDLGANRGVFTLAMAATGAQVHAFEPDPATRARLQEACAGHANVTIHAAAIGAQSGTALLRRMCPAPGSRLDPSLGSSTVMTHGRMSREDVVEVAQIALADVLAWPARPAALVKMDIEGAEVPALEALLQAGPGAARFEALFVETHEWQEPALDARVRALRAGLAGAGWPYINLYWH